MANTTFIYGLVDPRTKELRYIGKTDNPEIRAAQHQHDLRGDTHRSRWIRSLVRFGIAPEMLIIEAVNKVDWPEAERFWISHFRSLGCKLVNTSDGGDAGPQTPEVIEKRRQSLKITLNRPEVKKRFSDATKARWQDPKYREMHAQATREFVTSDAYRKAQSERFKKLWQDNVYREAVARGKNSPVYRQHQADATREKWNDPELREKFLAIRQSDEYRQKMSDVRKKEWADPEMRRKRSEAVKAAMQRPDVQSKITAPRGPRKKKSNGTK